MAVQYNSRIVTNGLVLCLDAANTKSYPGSGTSWSDLSGNGNTGTLTNGPTYSSANGGSIVFDGVNDYVTIPVNTIFEFGTGDFTLECFFYINSFSGSSGIINLISLGRGAYGGTGVNLVTCGWSLIVFTNIIYWYRYDGITETIISRNQSISTGVWNHIVVSRIGTNLDIFLNTTKLGNTTTNSTSYNQISTGGIQDIHIGRFFSGDPAGTPVGGTSYYSFFLNGIISNLRIYKGKGLTASEISQNFNALRGRYGI